MKKIKIGAILTTILLFFATFIFVFKNLDKTTRYILENVVDTNINVSSLKFESYKLVARKVEIRDLDNKYIGTIDKADIYINPFLVSRLLAVNITGGDIIVEQDKHFDLNLSNIVKKSQNPSVSRIGHVALLSFSDIRAKYINTKYDKIIEKDLENVSGTLIANVQNSIKFNVSGQSNNEKISFGYKKLPSLTNGILSLFSFRNDKDNTKKAKQFDFKFKDVNISKELAQFLPFDIFDIKSGTLNGDFSMLKEPDKDTIKLYGKLNIGTVNFRYTDYDYDIKNANAVINMNKHLVDVKVYTKIDNKNVNVNVLANIKDKLIDTKIKFFNMPYEYLKKYKLLANKKLDMSGNVDLDALISLDLKKKNKIVDIKADISSHKLNGFGFNLVDTKLNISNKRLTGITNIIKNSGVEISEKVDINFLVDFENFGAKGNILVDTNIKNLKLDKINLDVDMKSPSDINAKISSKNINGLLSYKNDKINMNLTTDELISAKYNNIDLLNKLEVKNLVYDTKEKQFTADIDLDTIIEKYDFKLNTSAKVKNNIWNVNSDVINKNHKLSIKGNTTKDLEHRYNISGDIEFTNVMHMLGLDTRNPDTANRFMPLNINTVLVGNNKKIDTYFSIKSNYTKYISEFHNININGSIKDILNNPDVNATISIDELWQSYQRLKNITADISYKDTKVVIDNINNEHLSGILTYDVKEKVLDTSLLLKQYMLYTTNPYLDINTNISALHILANGKLSDLSANMKLEPSFVVINGVGVGKLVSDMYIKDNVLHVENTYINKNKLSGTYDYKNKLIDMDIELQQKLHDFITLNNFKTNLSSKTKIKGKIDNLNATVSLDLKNVSYKNIELPQAKLMIEYTNGNIKNLYRTGMLNIKEVSVFNKEGNNIFTTNGVFDLENLNLNYNVKNKELDLAKFGKSYKGKLQIGAVLKGNLDDFYAELSLNSDKLAIKDNDVKDLALELRANKEGINIGQGYFEYKENPVLLEGYVIYKPLDYDIRMVANDFNLSFLKINPNISSASGIANIDFVINRKANTGLINIQDFNLVTKDKDYNIGRFNVDINMSNKDIEFNKFSGALNGGTVNIEGSLTLPEIPDDFMRTRRLKLGRFNLKSDINNVLLKYKKNSLVVTSDIGINGENVNGKLILNSGKITSLSMFDKKKKNKVKQSDYFVTLFQEILNNLIKQYTVDIEVQVEKPIKIDISNYLIVKDIGGELNAELNLIYLSGVPYIIGTSNINKGTFVVNNNVFTVEKLEVVFEDYKSASLDPTINLRAVTKVGEENIELIMNGALSERNIEFKSQSGKSRDEILELLALRGIKINTDNGLSFGKNVLNIATEIGINQLFNPITSRISKIFGLTKFDINANIEDKNKLEFKNLLNNASADIYLQTKILKNKELYFNTKASFPFNGDLQKIKYDIWTSYIIKDGIGANIGIKGQNGNDIKNVRFYGGINYSKKFDNFSEFLESFSNSLEKRETLR